MMGSTAMIIAAICTDVAVTVECLAACIMAWRELVSTWLRTMTSRIRWPRVRRLLLPGAKNAESLHAFHCPTAAKSASVASSALDKGRMMRRKICSSLAPSKRADSFSSAGISRKKLTASMQ